jgi:hypothetical protein
MRDLHRMRSDPVLAAHELGLCSSTGHRRRRGAGPYSCRRRCDDDLPALVLSTPAMMKGRRRGAEMGMSMP